MPGIGLVLVISANIGYFYYGTSIETAAVLLASALILMIGSISFQAFECKDDRDG